MGQKQSSASSSSSYRKMSDGAGRTTTSSLLSSRRTYEKQSSLSTLAVSEASEDSTWTRSTASSSVSINPEQIQEFYLKKRRALNKQGLHWQEDPTGKTWLHHTWNWPRDYATIRGTVVQVKGKKWLLATQVKQVDSDAWKRAPKGAALPFFHGNSYMLVPKKKYEPKNPYKRPNIVRFVSEPQVFTFEKDYVIPSASRDNSFDEQDNENNNKTVDDDATAEEDQR